MTSSIFKGGLRISLFPLSSSDIFSFVGFFANFNVINKCMIYKWVRSCMYINKVLWYIIVIFHRVKLFSTASILILTTCYSQARFERKQTSKDAPAATDDGYIEKLMAQIIRNIQITITQVHVRWVASDHHYAGAREVTSFRSPLRRCTWGQQLQITITQVHVRSVASDHHCTGAREVGSFRSPLRRCTWGE